MALWSLLEGLDSAAYRIYEHKFLPAKLYYILSSLCLTISLWLFCLSHSYIPSVAPLRLIDVHILRIAQYYGAFGHDASVTGLAWFMVLE